MVCLILSMLVACDGYVPYSWGVGCCGFVGRGRLHTGSVRAGQNRGLEVMVDVQLTGLSGELWAN